MPPPGKQVTVPEELPEILKAFTKAAIRTQPADIVHWSAMYFTALANGQPLPTKSEILVPTSHAEFSIDHLKTLHEKFGSRCSVYPEELAEKWMELNLSEGLLRDIMTVGNFGEEVDWLKCIALACSALGGTITNAIKYACCILTSDPNCPSEEACIPYHLFRFLYTYLADIDGEISQGHIDRALTYLEEEV
ncbi:ROP1 protein, partial [Polyodon spathula]|nr:ROP1 protein [Polyodon spathula]